MSGQTNGSGSGNSQCVKFGPAAQRTVAVAIDLVGWTVVHSPSVLRRVLEEKSIQDQLAAALKKAGDELMKEQAGGQAPRFDETLAKLGSTAGGVVRDPAKKQVERSAEFKRLETSLQQLKCAFENAPMGAFVNENKTLLIVVGSVAAIGGGVAMYLAKTGDIPAKTFSLLPSLVPKRIGSVNLGMQKFELKPSEQKVSADGSVGGKWSAVEASLNLGATFAHDALTRAAGSGKLTLYVNADWQTTAKASFTWTRENGDVRGAINGAAEVGVRRKLSNNADVTLQVFGNYVDNEKTLSRQAGVRADLVSNKAMGRDSRLTVSPSYSVTKSQARDEYGIQPTRTDHRVMVNLKLEFDLGGGKKSIRK